MFLLPSLKALGIRNIDILCLIKLTKKGKELIIHLIKIKKLIEDLE